MNKKEVIGILGGLGPASTADFYLRLNQKLEMVANTEIEMLICGLNFEKFKELQQTGNRGEIIDVLQKGIDKLVGGGATFIAIPSNTIHIYYRDMAKHATIPLLNIIELTKAYISKNQLDRPLLLGTSFTSRSRMYDRSLRKEGIDLLKPEETQQKELDRLIFNEFTSNQYSDKGIAFVQSLATLSDCNTLILACTELGPIFRYPIEGKTIVDTVEVLVDACIEQAVQPGL